MSPSPNRSGTAAHPGIGSTSDEQPSKSSTNGAEWSTARPGPDLAREPSGRRGVRRRKRFATGAVAAPVGHGRFAAVERHLDAFAAQVVVDGLRAVDGIRRAFGVLAGLQRDAAQRIVDGAPLV